ncbi:hypothetical protein [Sphingobacterium sp.]|uniref:hypothetical protein n=1 Tax=Sphingobacterium sp. TaxID=341027 RepID=UPI0031DC838E
MQKGKDEFLNRVTVQRSVLQLVNKEKDLKFPLVGLSSKAIERWQIENKIPTTSTLLEFIYLISSKLFFLANKSQEQINPEYIELSKSVAHLVAQLRTKLQNQQTTIVSK